MSGICGIVNFDNRPVENSSIKRLLSSMQNRGHDREGIWVRDNTGFGHTMLWTTPESKFEKQPLVNPDYPLVLVADARIDNRSELLSKLGTRSKGGTLSDADLILLAYQKWGDRCVEHLIGDFSFALYDQKDRTLFLARDHLGFRPLYYFHYGDTFVFSSEIQALFALSILRREVDPEAIDYSLFFDSIPRERTYFKHIYRVSGGTTVQLSGNTMSSRRYWKPENYELRRNVSFDDAIEEFLEIFSEALSARLRSAYPVGCELSGGLDSSSVITSAVKLSNSGLLCPLSLRFGDMACDEGDYIDAVCRTIGKPPIEVRADQLDFKSKHTLASYYAFAKDWPVDLFFIPHLALADRAEEQGIRVMLTGQGGDEVMQGSRQLYNDYLQNMDFRAFGDELLRSNAIKRDLLNFVMKPLVPDVIKSSLKMMKTWLCNQDVRAAIIKKKEMALKIAFSENGYEYRSAWDTARMINNCESALWRDCNSYNLYARNNIEVRHPFFDIRLIAFRMSLPAHFFYQHGEFKRLLRVAMQGLLPELVRSRQDKTNFDDLVKKQLSIEKAKLATHEEMFENIISSTFWMTIQDLHAKRNFRDHQYFLEWKMLNLHHWYRQNFTI